MASTQQLKSRIRSVNNTRQITKAMELVAASKMRKSQDSSKATELYSRTARELLTYLSQQNDIAAHPLFKKRTIKKRLLIVITSDKGLAGAYNTNIMKKYTQALKEDDNDGILSETIAIGREGSQFVTRIKDTEIVGAYHDFADKPTGNEVKPIINSAMSKFINGDVDAVDVIYTEYVNSMTQNAMIERILPAGFIKTDSVEESVRLASFEPSSDAVLEGAAKRLIEAQLFQALLDAKASEYSMRMVAMKNATDNATDLSNDLTLEMNKVRQAAITQELAEISGGAEAVA